MKTFIYIVYLYYTGIMIRIFLAEKGNLSEVLSKPKIMPIKSITLQKIEKMEQEAAARKEV